jgi:ribosomal protein S17E
MKKIKEQTQRKSINELNKKLINIALNSIEFKEQLKFDSEEITKEAKIAKNEATIEGAFERVLYATLRGIGIKFHPEKEVAVETRRHIGKGRMDSRIGAMIIEYKHRTKLQSEVNISKAFEQIENYISSKSKEINNDIVGYLTDGIHLYEIRASNGKIISESGKLPINDRVLLGFIRSIVSLEQSALNSKNLIRDFCGNQYDGALFDVAKILNVILEKNPTPKTQMLWSEWEELFRLAHDDHSQQRRIKDRRVILSDIFKEKINDAPSEYRTLFALHSAYAIVLKFIAYRVVSDIQFGSPLKDYKSLISAESQALRSFCADLEDGEIFRKLGILNLLEGDFFSWYSDKNQWNDDLAESLQSVIQILGRYEDVSTIFASEDAIDLFRDLYESTIPQIIRGSFGEFYTPFWLAEHVITSSIKEENWRVLDPCCGSGTFVIVAISHIRKKYKGKTDDKTLLKEILSRVVAIDLNPLAVLTTRIHYFIHIADLLPKNPDNLVIPVFLGDASYVPEKIDVAGTKCLTYRLHTLKDPISIILPISIVEKTSDFVQLMFKYEYHVRNLDSKSAMSLLVDSLDEKDRKDEINKKLSDLTDRLVNLQKNKWNGIWARIITNFLTTACLGEFSNIVGNPPWIDWKNLPEGYREKVKSFCDVEDLFSGAGRTGGINLNICALITHVSATNWLSENGYLAFLMPRELAYQSSYEGWIKSVGGPKRDFIKFNDWSKSGHPFDTSKEDFMTFILGPKQENNNVFNTVPVTEFIKKKDSKTKAHEWKNIYEAMKNLDENEAIAGQITPGSNSYTFTKDKSQLQKFSKITGECYYIGREGIEFYPQELLLFKYIGPGPKKDTAWLENIQVKRSKFKIPKQKILLETKYLYPLVKGCSIDRFSHSYEGFIVPFPYEQSEPHKPVGSRELDNVSHLLFDYYGKYEGTIAGQTDFSDKIRGPDAGEFYGLARTGPYSFQNVYVGFRDNTKWCAVVITPINMPWGEKKRFVFQNHAVSICERRNKGGFIQEDEAHYICAILNAPVVEDYIYASSDNRSFKIRLPVFIPRYNKDNEKHKKLSQLSRQAHKNDKDHDSIRNKIEDIYLKICDEESENGKRLKLLQKIIPDVTVENLTIIDKKFVRRIRR